MRQIIGIIMLSLLSGCSSTSSDLEAKSAATVQNYTDNYQVVFRRVSNSARQCLTGNLSAYASMEVDAQLYSELGFGEITQSLINMGARTYYISAKIEKTDKGSRMTVRTANTLGVSKWRDSMFRWAGGDESC